MYQRPSSDFQIALSPIRDCRSGRFFPVMVVNIFDQTIKYPFTCAYCVEIIRTGLHKSHFLKIFYVQPDIGNFEGDKDEKVCPLALLIRDREDAVLVTLGLALDLLCLDPDPKGTFDDPGKQAGCTVTDGFTGVPEGFGLDRMRERDGF
jgi:hypothetical protein